MREEAERKVTLSRPKFYDFITAVLRLRLLDDEHAKMAGQVENLGNQVLHGKPSDEKQSFKALAAARQLLVYLYGLSNDR